MPQGDHIRVDDTVVLWLRHYWCPGGFVFEQVWLKYNQYQGIISEQVGALTMGRTSSMM